jgi:hypothetical protein
MDWQAITSVDYWTRLNPQLTIGQGGDAPERPHWQPDAAFVEALPHRLAHLGYFQMPQAVATDDAATLAAGIVTLQEAAWMPAFCFVYDDYWRIFWQVRQALALALGQDYRMMPSMWAWYIEPSDGAGGWRPHRDRGVETLRGDLSPTALTVWIPLTDATPDNGCIHVVPAHLDPNYLNNDALTARMHDIRALPGPAGTAMSWTHNLLHWGGRSSDFAPHPRISVSVEFQSNDVPAWDVPLLDPFTLPTFEQRIALICKGLLQYRHMHLERFEEGDVDMAMRLRDEGLGLTPQRL